MISSQDLIKKIAETGLPHDHKGNCLGIAVNGASSLIVEDMPSLISRLEALGLYTNADINEKITNAKEQQKKHHQNAKQKVQKKWLESGEVKPTFKEFDKNLTAEQNQQYYRELSLAYSAADTQLSKEEQTLLFSIAPFFETVALSQNTLNYRHLFDEKSAEGPRSLPCTPALPLMLESKNEIASVVNAEKWDGLYFKNELSIYFEILTDKLKKSNIKHPIALILRNGPHAITVGWEPAKKAWRFISIDDFEKMKVNIPDFKTIMELVYKSMTVYQQLSDTHFGRFVGWFFTNFPILFSTNILCKQNDLVAVKLLMAECKKDLRWQNIHAVTRDKYNRMDSLGYRWLEIASFNNNIDTVHDLLKLKTIYKNYPPFALRAALTTAIASENPEMVEVILEAKANINDISTKGETPLLQAAAEGNHHIVNLLLKNGAKIDLCNSSGASPLHGAAFSGSLLSVKTLIDHKASVNVSTVKGHTPLLFATIMDHHHIVKYLLEQKNIHVNIPIETSLPELQKDLNKNIIDKLKKLLHEKNITSTTFKNLSVLLVAILYDRIEIVKSLLKADAIVSTKIEDKISIFELAEAIGNSKMIQLIKLTAFLHTSKKFQLFGEKPPKQILSTINEYIKFPENSEEDYTFSNKR